jgi:hypothetical protein
MLHACNAVDGTAGKQYPRVGNKQRFTRLLRENYDVLGPMGAPNIDLQATRWPVPVNKPTAPRGGADLADVLYGVHRCTHGHGDVLPKGFDLLPDARGPAGITRMRVVDGAAQLSDRVVFGLLAVAVLSRSNAAESAPDGYLLSYGDRLLPLNEWWGRKVDFLSVVREGPKLIAVVLDFGDWATGG